MGVQKALLLSAEVVVIKGHFVACLHIWRKPHASCGEITYTHSQVERPRVPNGTNYSSVEPTLELVSRWSGVAFVPGRTRTADRIDEALEEDHWQAAKLARTKLFGRSLKAIGQWEGGRVGRTARRQPDLRDLVLDIENLLYLLSLAICELFLLEWSPRGLGICHVWARTDMSLRVPHRAFGGVDVATELAFFLPTHRQRGTHIRMPRSQSLPPPVRSIVNNNSNNSSSSSSNSSSKLANMHIICSRRRPVNDQLRTAWP